MSWSEIKKLSDVMIDSTRFSEVINKEANLGTDQSITISGSGKAFVKTIIGNGWIEFYVDGQYVPADVFPYDSMATARFPAIDFSKSFSVVMRNVADPNVKSSGTITVVAFLRDNISIGGGYSKLVPFNRRKAVAA